MTSLTITGEALDSDFLRTAIRKIVANPLRARISEREATELHEAIALRHPQAESGVLCESCKKEVNKTSLVGSLLAGEVRLALEEQRQSLGVLTVPIDRGQLSRIQWPEGYSSFRYVDSAGDGWVEVPRSQYSTPQLWMYPEEFYLNSIVTFDDKTLSCGVASTVDAFRNGVNQLVSDILGKEKAFLGEDDPSKLRRVNIRKELDSRLIDTYNMGRPSHGWFMETIISIVEFAK